MSGRGGKMSIEYGSALLIGIILLMVGILSTLFPEEDQDKHDPKSGGEGKKI
jgi:hypothetical protein